MHIVWRVTNITNFDFGNYAVRITCNSHFLKAIVCKKQQDNQAKRIICESLIEFDDFMILQDKNKQHIFVAYLPQTLNQTTKTFDADMLIKELQQKFDSLVITANNPLNLEYAYFKLTKNEICICNYQQHQIESTKQQTTNEQIQFDDF